MIFGVKSLAVLVLLSFSIQGCHRRGSVSNPEILYQSHQVTDETSADYEANVTVNSVGDGFALALVSINRFDPSGVMAKVTKDSLEIDSLDGEKADFIVGTKLASKLKLGDMVHVIIERRGDTFTAIADRSYSRDSVSATSNEGAGKVFGANSTRASVLNFGGQYTVHEVKTVSRTPNRPNLCIVGDSKSTGYGSGSFSRGYGILIDSLGPVAIFAGGGDTTEQVLADIPVIISKGCRNVLLNIGYNDIGFGVPAAKWQANYAAIVKAFNGSGIHVVHLLSIPSDAGVDVAPLNAYINANFNSDDRIDPSVGWANSEDLNADHIHPNARGYALVAKRVLESGMIPPKP